MRKLPFPRNYIPRTFKNIPNLISTKIRKDRVSVYLVSRLYRTLNVYRAKRERKMANRCCISILHSARANKFRKSLEFVVPGEREGSRDPNETISFTRHRSSAGRETRIIVHLFIRSIGNAITTVHNGYGRRNYRANRHLRFIVSLTTELCILFS